MATSGQGVDYDGMFGMQCVDIVFDLTGNYCGQLVSGNAIDLLDNARAVGYNVVSGNAEPQLGYIFIYRYVSSLRAWTYMHNDKNYILGCIRPDYQK